MKLSKTKKIILLGASIGILTTMIVTPIVLLNNNENNQDEQNQKDVESLIKILEEKNQDERILKFSSNLTGKIVANNQEKIVAKIKTLIGASNLKETKIEVSMENDQNISPNFAKIQIKVSKGKYSKMVDSKKPYFVIREQNQQEIIADVNSVKIALTKLATKTLELKAKVDDKTINGNKDGILDTLKQIEGYLEIKFKKVKIEVKENSNQLPSHNATPINIVFVLSKGTYNSELTGFNAKQLAPNQVNIIRRELNELKSSLENLETKEVEVYAPSEDKTIIHNKAAIKSAIENLDGYDEIDLNGVSLEVKNSGNNLPNNDQPATSIILVLSKNNVDVEVQGFSAKQSLTITSQDKINQIKEKITDKDILIAPNVSTQNQSEIQSAIKNQLQKENPFLTNDDLSKISTSVSSLILGTRTEVILNISVDSRSLPLSIYVEKANLLKGSNIVSGNGGAIFQDEFKNLWSMSSSITKDVNNVKKTIHTKLQVLKVNQVGDGYVNSWTNDNGENGEPLLKGSNIVSGLTGTIFQDQFKNLWAMGYNTPLQVLRVNQNGDGYDETTGWTSATNSGLTKNSNIADGYNGTIFQDQFKNLWTMTHNSTLQVLKANDDGDGYDETTGWTSATNSGLTKNSNIAISGSSGIIFQDEFKNLWTIGVGTKLQVLRVNENGDGYDETTGWTSANSGLTKNSNIIDGQGIIFQDEFKNLWVMGSYKSLQVLRVNREKNGYDETTGWTSANSGLTKNSNITNGLKGTIFQDEFKNLWAIGYLKNLQVLRVNSSKTGYDETTGWTSANSGLTKNSNINNNGTNTTIFQDQFKNLWVMNGNTKLQVLRVNSSKTGYDEITGWSDNNDQNTGDQLLKGSNIANGNGGTIFQDEFKNLWVMAFKEIKTIEGSQKTIYTKLQVLKVNVDGNGYVDSWQKPSD